MAHINFRIIVLATIVSVFAVSHFYLWARISHFLQLTPGQRHYLAYGFAFLGTVTFVSLPISRILPRDAASILMQSVFPWMGFLLLMLAVMLVVDLIWIVLKSVPLEAVRDPLRWAFAGKTFGVAALGATLAFGLVSLRNDRRFPEVKSFDVTLEKLPKSLDGLRIVQLTDMHISPMTNGDWVRRVVEKTNALSPDIIVMTGDLADGSVRELSNDIAPIADLKARFGVYFVTGNHEFYSGASEWCSHLEKLGMRVLRNERVSIAAGPGGESIDLAGVDDFHSREFTGRGPDLSKALEGRDASKPLVLLAHQPVAVKEASAAGVDLQLSGHTHGGQIWPFNYLVYLQQPYIEGLHRDKDTATQIYVNSGTGSWGPPMRLGTVAEIAQITLRAPMKN
ncbi:MAG: metallophosphoesterase [Alphaproteobacteria bacterium]|nr:metallophosphoesterase [Alphaproteobacteria bacterium]